MKGIEIKKVYDDKKFLSEINDQGSETVTTGYIPIDEQVKMIIRGEITIGIDNYIYTDDDEIEKQAPEEVFEDFEDVGSLYQDDVRDAVLAQTKKPNGNTEAQQLDLEGAIKAQQASDANERSVAQQASDASE